MKQDSDIPKYLDQKNVNLYSNRVSKKINKFTETLNSDFLRRFKPRFNFPYL